MKTVFITGADRGVGLALCECFLKEGWQVFAGRFMPRWKELDELKEQYGEKLALIALDVSCPESVARAAEEVKGMTKNLDMLINCAGIFGGDEPDKIRDMFRVNTLGPMCMAEHFLPLMENGMKRLCFVSSEAGSISVAHREGTYGYGMSKASLNMAVRLMFNELNPRGYTFRLYHPGWVRSYMLGDEKNVQGTYEPEESAAAAYETFVSPQAGEDVLRMTDITGKMWPF